MEVSVEGKVAIVTGASRGIGLATALEFARSGASGVTITSRKPENLEQARQELVDAGVPDDRILATAARADEAEDAERAVAETVGRFGAVDILVNNAGTNIRKRPEDLAPDEWHRVLDTNLTSAYLCSRACYPAFKRAGGGKILNNGSMLSIFGTPWGPAYAASKGGIVQLTKSMATAWAADNIQVNCFLPGWIDTDLTRKARQEVEGLHERVLARTPAGRWGDIEDFEGLAIFLASPASSFITGIAIPVDGGFSVSG